MFTNFRFVVKPLIQTIIHAQMYENYQDQIRWIAFFDVVSLLSLVGFEMMKGASKSKSFFVSDCIFDFSLAAINCTLYFKQVVYPELSD